MLKELAIATLVAGGVCAADATGASRPLATADAACASRSGNLMPSAQANLPLTKEWDKTFPKSDKVEHAKVTFKNRFGITLAADVYKPKVGNGERGTGNGERGAVGIPQPKAVREADALAGVRARRARRNFRRSRCRVRLAR